MDSWSADEIVKKADEFGKMYANPHDSHDKVTTNQLRNVYSTITKIKTDYNKNKNANKDNAKIIRDLTLLKPKLAYIKGRDSRNKGIEAFYNLVVGAIDQTIKSKNFIVSIENFFEFMEALVAYHKFYGGK